MVFPGVLRGLPGPRLATTPTSRPRRSLSSPGVYVQPILPGAASSTMALSRRRGPGARSAQLAGAGEARGSAAATPTPTLARRGPGALDPAGPGHEHDAGQAA